jgi:hypothetical protein
MDTPKVDLKKMATEMAKTAARKSAEVGVYGPQMEASVVSSVYDDHMIQFDGWVPPGETARCVWNADRVFRGRKIVIAEESAPHFEILAIRVGMDIQPHWGIAMASRCTCEHLPPYQRTSLSAHKSECPAMLPMRAGSDAYPYPATLLAYGNLFDLMLDTATPGICVSIEIKNKSAERQPFRATLEGKVIVPSQTASAISTEPRTSPARLTRLKMLGPVLVKAHEVAEVRLKLTETDPPFTVDRLAVSSEMRHFMLESWKVNDVSVLGLSAQNLPIAVFHEDSSGIRTVVDEHGTPLVLKFRDEMVMRIRNDDKEDRIFAAMLAGEWSWESHDDNDLAEHLLIGTQLGGHIEVKVLGDCRRAHRPGESVRVEVQIQDDWFSTKQIIVSPLASRFRVDDVLVAGQSAVRGEKPFSATDLDEHQVVRDRNLAREPRLDLARARRVEMGETIVMVVTNISDEPSMFHASAIGIAAGRIVAEEKCPKCGGAKATAELEGCTVVSCVVRPT